MINLHYKKYCFLSSAAISRSFKNLWGGNSRTGRSHQPRSMDPELTRQALLYNYKAVRGDYSIASSRSGKFTKRIIYLHNLFIVFPQYGNLFKYHHVRATAVCFKPTKK